MSSGNSTVSSAEEIVADRAFFFQLNCALIAEAIVIFYEYLITFDSEIRLVWSRRITGASVLFFLNRYIMLLQNVITVPSFVPISNTACRALGWMDIILSLLPYFVWNAFSTLRTYALCGRDRRIPALVCLLLCGPVVANLYNIPYQKPANSPPPYNCGVANSITLAITVVLVSRLSSIAADAIVISVTWWTTYKIKKTAVLNNVKTSLVDLLLRDGSVYFCTMLVFNVLHIVVNFAEEVSFMGDIADVITSILVSRFIINLRDLDSRDLLEQSHSGSTAGGTVVFASNLIESMGAPLERSSIPIEVGDGDEPET
ncbi:hypothetical protein L226DRAFT_455382 [Lentinus tigrinus ALCF2SS1-7]|uniref:DUF6533 domain-containing protein n=1 Tax=Lentinus tigrinus ALCF2SS1-6 TaxID=1328759 RepID=A0A5C2S1C3_9APHY|nr:hypothetical protein L227DRAFT_508376 [Lentinus tigrinus ALCF2SS1-6]RPD79538.1 hypothetical protein L226DRAFT_455382 [Lentinus tigrinus ALCF2SS1-7]